MYSVQKITIDHADFIYYKHFQILQIVAIFCKALGWERDVLITPLEIKGCMQCLSICKEIYEELTIKENVQNVTYQ